MSPALKKGTRAGKGVDESIEKIYCRLWQPVLNRAFWWLNNLHDAEDVTAQTLLKFWRNYDPNHKSGANCKTFAFTICDNLCKNRLSRKVETIAIDELCEEQADKKTCPDDYVERQEFKELVREAIEMLSPKERSAICLVMEEKTYAEIAVKLNCKVNTVYQLVYQAKTHLKKLAIETGLAEYI